MASKRKRSPFPAAPPKKRGRPRKQPEQPGLCTVEKCGRPSCARGFCQTHHRQMKTFGKVKQIRPYRQRSPDTVKFSGLRLTPDCVEVVKAYADQRGLSVGAAIAEILEDWNETWPMAPGER